MINLSEIKITLRDQEVLHLLVQLATAMYLREQVQPSSPMIG